MTATLHRIACGCGWSYETNHRDFGSLYCRRAYEQHTPNCPLRLAAVVSGTDRAEQGATRPQETSMQVDDGYGDERWEGVDPHATYLRNLPVEPIPEWMQTAVSGTDRAEQ